MGQLGFLSGRSDETKVGVVALFAVVVGVVVGDLVSGGVYPHW